MIVFQRLKPRTRLQALVAAAAILAGLAAASNLIYWRVTSTRGPATGLRRGASRSAPTEPASPRAAEIRQLERYLTEYPLDTRAHFRLAELYFAEREYPRALAELDVLERAQPKNPDLYLRRAMVYKYTGKWSEAEKAARRALALRPQYEEAREWLGEIYLGQGRSQEALAVFDQCVKRNPRSYLALMGQSRAYEQLLISRSPVGLSQMTRPVEKAIRLDPDNPWGVVTLARMTFNYLARLDPAEKLALRAAELDPRDAEPYLILAEIALHRPPTPENLRKAGLYAYQAAQRAPRDWRPPYEMGRALLLQNEPAEAVKLLERSVAVQPMPEAIYQLSLAYGRAGNAEQARHYGEIYQRWNDLMERRKTLLGEIQREPRRTGAYYQIAELYLKAGAPEPAENWLRKARTLAPGDARYERLMGQVRRLRASGGHSPLPALP